MAVPKAWRSPGEVRPRLTPMWDWALPTYRVMGRIGPLADLNWARRAEVPAPRATIHQRAVIIAVTR